MYVSRYVGGLLESLDWVLEELYEERWSEMYDEGVNAGVASAGVFVALLNSDAVGE